MGIFLLQGADFEKWWSGPGRTRTYEGIMPAELQSAPFAARDTDPKELSTIKKTNVNGSEPMMGLEPITYALQERRSAN